MSTLVALAGGSRTATSTAGSFLLLILARLPFKLVGGPFILFLVLPATNTTLPNNPLVAVDPKVIPLRTRLYIPGYGFAIAGDTGGSIKGDKIDLGFDDVKTGWWSSRFTDIYLDRKSIRLNSSHSQISY